MEELGIENEETQDGESNLKEASKYLKVQESWPMNSDDNDKEFLSIISETSVKWIAMIFGFKLIFHKKTFFLKTLYAKLLRSIKFH